MSREYKQYEPVLGDPKVAWYKLLWYRLCLLLCVDMISSAFVFFAVMVFISYKMLGQVSDLIGLGILVITLLSALNWTMRKYAGPFLEAICDWIRGAPKLALTSQTVSTAAPTTTVSSNTPQPSSDPATPTPTIENA